MPLDCQSMKILWPNYWNVQQRLVCVRVSNFESPLKFEKVKSKWFEQWKPLQKQQQQQQQTADFNQKPHKQGTNRIYIEWWHLLQNIWFVMKLRKEVKNHNFSQFGERTKGKTGTFTTIPDRNQIFNMKKNYFELDFLFQLNQPFFLHPSPLSLWFSFCSKSYSQIPLKHSGFQIICKILPEENRDLIRIETTTFNQIFELCTLTKRATLSVTGFMSQFVHTKSSIFILINRFFSRSILRILFYFFRHRYKVRSMHIMDNDAEPINSNYL